jgi:hypothetical protein bacD2_00593
MPANRIKLEPALERRYARQKAHRKERKIVTRILIVCEGEKTEPNYFNAFKEINQGTMIIEVEGCGKNTISVVEEAIRLSEQVKGTEQKYDRVWAVFDKDSFSDRQFNDAIAKARQAGIHCAWSNEAFELWFLYHFQFVDTAMHRSQYEAAISKAVNRSGKYNGKRYRYQKNARENYRIMTECGSQENALKNAARADENFTDKNYATHNPCTQVYKLVKQLIGKDATLLMELKKEVNKK